MNVHKEIDLWMAKLAESTDLTSDQVEELRSHLLDSMDHLRASGLKEDEAYLIAVRRLGSVHELASSHVRQKADRIWKDLFRETASSNGGSNEKAARWFQGIDPFTVLMFVAVVIATLLPQWTGHGFETNSIVYFLNVSWMVLPMMAFLYLRRDWLAGHRSSGSIAARAAILFAPMVVNLYPMQADTDTTILAMLSLPILSWLALSLFRDREVASKADARMDFIRFTGESLVYSVLVGLSAMALIGLTAALYSMFGIDFEPIFESFVAVIFPATLFIGMVLVERKRSLVENFAPVLARIIAPMLLIVLGIFTFMLFTIAVTEEAGRDMLILMDVLLLAVVMVVIYSVSTQSDLERRPIQDIIHLLLVSLALVSDVYALTSTVSRIAEYGLSPNKLAALGMNLLLLGNLAILLAYYVRQIRTGVSAERLLSAQGLYFALYYVWLAVVALGFPWLFRFL